MLLMLGAKATGCSIRNMGMFKSTDGFTFTESVWNPIYGTNTPASFRAHQTLVMNGENITMFYFADSTGYPLRRVEGVLE